MKSIPISEIIERLHQETGLSPEMIQDQIKAKVHTLDGLVSEEGAAYIIASELGVQLLKPQSKTRKIGELENGDLGIDAAGKVTRIYSVRTFPRKDGSVGEVASIVISDQTGTARVVFWDKKTQSIKDGKITEGDIIRIKDANVRQNNFGGKEIHLNARSFIAINPKGLDIKASGRITNKKIISQIIPGENVSVVGTIVKAYPPRFYYACKTCNKKVALTPEGAFCKEHNKTEVEQNMLVSIVLDDGTETIRCVAFRNTAENVCGFTAKEGYEILTKDGENILSARLDEFLLGRQVECIGGAKENKNVAQTEIMLNSVDLNPNPKNIASKLLVEKNG